MLDSNPGERPTGQVKGPSGICLLLSDSLFNISENFPSVMQEALEGLSHLLRFAESSPA